MSDDTTLNAEEFKDALRVLAKWRGEGGHDMADAWDAATAHDAALRAEVERLTERDQCAVQRSITASEVVLLERAKAAEAEVERLRTERDAWVTRTNAALRRLDQMHEDALTMTRKHVDAEARVAVLTEALGELVDACDEYENSGYSGGFHTAKAAARAVLGGTEPATTEAEWQEETRRIAEMERRERDSAWGGTETP